MSVTTPCANHRDRERLASCGVCGAALCRECIVQTPVGIKCAACTGGKPAPARPQPAGTGSPRRRWLAPAAVATALAIGLGLFLVSRGDGGSPTVDDEFARSEPERAVERAFEIKVDLPGGSATRIGAFLTLPPDARPPVGGVVIVPGFGTIDHDAVMATTTPDGSADRLSQDLNYSRPGSPDNLFRDVNDSLVAADLATLRYDKRGSGTSPLRADQALSYDDLMADAKAAVGFLAERREVAGKPLAVVGFDQGGLIAMRLAASDPRVKAVVLLSTFGRPLVDVIGDDLVVGQGEQAGTAQSAQLHDVVAKLLAGQPLPAQQDLLANLRALLRPNQEQYLRTVFGLDPVAEARNVKVPALVVRGEKDTTITAVDSERLKSALPAGTEEVIVAGADHNLGVNTVRDPVVLSRMAQWLSRRVGGG
jgi:pimeloyl-ACP methyl ester carboxylesterase